MRTAPTRERRPPPDESGSGAPKNYITPQGYARIKAELTHLLDVERPELVKVVAWAASNGDRSENGDYLYGKKRLREIDRRIHYLTKRLDTAVVVDPATRRDTEQIYFGASVTYARNGIEEAVVIVGIDEADVQRGRVSWISPIAKALLKRQPGDVVMLATPQGQDEIEIIEVCYRPLT
ncbi:MAG TPA: transcription elongation factor GreB [Burkholderiales bacterium]